MDFWIKFLSYINLAGAIHALIQSMLLFFIRRGNRRANKIMAFFLLALAIGMANGIISLLGLYEIWPALSILMGSVILTYGPLFYLYIRAMTDKDHRWTPFDVLHGVPFLLGMLVYGAYLRLPGDGSALSGFIGFAVRSPWLIVTILSTLQTVVYVASVIRLLWAHSERIKATYSTIDRINLGWLRRRLVVYAAIWAVGLAMVAAVRFESRAIGLVGQIVSFLIALNTFMTGYLAMLQPEIFFGPFEARPARRYERSSLTPENAALHKTRLLELMEREKSFLDPEITLPKLAQALEIPVAHLSRVINDLFGRNFYEFINHYRVEDAKRRLAMPDAGREKLITVALDCGFNSVATFNRVFKELAGRTPSEYRKNPTVP
ncbi:MAG: helix-turn-helix transcriptional regulator [Candidatus Aminicenantes bacterium]|nr:helix-turn-helix transcriptional regulator [Candidatus Aminicenantes bacterium]